ncbi:hypothetical protein Tco_0394678 [Tanacetum coccineum]
MTAFELVQTLKDRLTVYGSSNLDCSKPGNGTLPFASLCSMQAISAIGAVTGAAVMLSEKFKVLPHHEQKAIVHTGPISALKYLFAKKDDKGEIAPMYLLLQEYDLQRLSTQQKNKFFKDVKHYFWTTLSCLNFGGTSDRRRCVARAMKLLRSLTCHNGPTGDIMVSNLTAKKIFDSGFSGPSIYKMPTSLSRTVTLPSRQGKTSQRDECLKTPSKVYELFDSVWHRLLWARSQSSTREQVDSRPSTICQNGFEAQALPTNDGPDCDDSQFCHSIQEFSHLQLQWESIS